MNLGNLLKGQGDKQSPVIAIVLIVVILVAAFLLLRNFMGGEAPVTDDMAGQTAPTGPTPPTAAPSAPGPPTSGPPMPGPPTPEMAPPPPGPTAPPATGPAAPAAPSAPATPPATAPPSPAPPARPKPGPAGSAASEVDKNGMRTTPVFGSVSVSYPKGWGIDPRVTDRAVFTDKKATFEVHTPDPKAKTAKEIAQAALKKVAAKGKVIKEAPDKVSGFDAYWYAVSIGGKTMRVVGIDGPTRVAVVAHAPSSLFPKYRDTFNRMQAAIKFK